LALVLGRPPGGVVTVGWLGWVLACSFRPRAGGAPIHLRDPGVYINAVLGGSPGEPGGPR
ncbi:hypothetical protein, partial [Nocardia abscessus]|uniref:hypothetical protein n=1 Tax=Nocardia abscessus TaxID=120957 RepID=UPI00245666E1